MCIGFQTRGDAYFNYFTTKQCKGIPFQIKFEKGDKLSAEVPQYKYEVKDYPVVKVSINDKNDVKLLMFFMFFKKSILDFSTKKFIPFIEAYSIALNQTVKLTFQIGTDSISRAFYTRCKDFFNNLSFEGTELSQPLKCSESFCIGSYGTRSFKSEDELKPRSAKFQITEDWKNRTIKPYRGAVGMFYPPPVVGSKSFPLCQCMFYINLETKPNFIVPFLNSSICYDNNLSLNYHIGKVVSGLEDLISLARRDQQPLIINRSGISVENSTTIENDSK